MDDSGVEDGGTNQNYTNEGHTEDDAAAEDEAAAEDTERVHRHGLGRYARPALIAGSVVAVVCVALLVIIFFLDSFNATVYSVGGKDVKDATDEARAIRETYAAARVGGIVFLVTGVALAAAGAVVIYRHRNDRGPNRDGDDGEDVDFDELGGR